MAVVVRIPGLLRSYTAGAPRVELPELSAAATLDDALAALDLRHQGLRFRIVDEQRRIRRHIKIFAAGELLVDLDRRLPDDSELLIVGALSGGD